MNNRGIAFLYFLAIGTIIIILGYALAGPITTIVNEKMNDLTCASPANNFDQAACWAMDILKPLTIGVVVLIGFYLIL